MKKGQERQSDLLQNCRVVRLLCWSFLTLSDFWYFNGFWVITQKPAILPYVLFRHGGNAGWSAGSLDKAFKVNPLRMIQAKFGLNWPWFQRRRFLKKFTDGRRTPSEGNSSHRRAKMGNNSKMGNEVYFKIVGYVDATNFCNLNLTFISYSFWNIRQKELLQNCRVGRSWHALHVCSFNLPSVS